MTLQAEIAVLGLGTMGSALARNLLNQGYSVAGYNRTYEKTKKLPVLAKQRWLACETVEELVQCLQKPRKIIVMLPAGATVDNMLNILQSVLEKGDMILDGGNSYFEDTERRSKVMEALGIHYFALGVSGGEEGALKGPSLMPSGNKEAYASVRPYLESIAAQEKGEPCCVYLGGGGAGHYVKMVHNGIEYADMQLLAEVYVLLKQIFGLTNQQISTIFHAWNKTDLHSYLVGISVDILVEQDPQGQGELLDAIVDKASQKGTGGWTSIEALRQGQAATLISGAVHARVISNLEKLRDAYYAAQPEPKSLHTEKLLEEVEWIRETYAVSKRMAYAQGFSLLYDAGKRYGWEYDLSSIAAIFRKGCIIQAALLEEIMLNYTAAPQLEHLLLSSQWHKSVTTSIPALRKAVLAIVQHGVAAPLITATLSYIDQLSSPLLGANFIQAQRDYFGAHTFERKGKKGMEHHEWKKY